MSSTAFVEGSIVARETIALLVWVVAVGVFIDSLNAQEREIGVVRSSHGEAYIVREGVTAPAQPGQPVQEGDILETGADGTLGIVLEDTTQISLGDNSRFHMSEFRFEPLRNDYSLIGRILDGTFVFISGDIGRLSPRDVRLETPSGIIGIRGTRLAVALAN